MNCHAALKDADVSTATPGAAGATANPLSDRDHAALAQLLERATHVCCDTASRRGDCGACGEASRVHCHDALGEIATALMTLMLAHIHLENTLMAQLPSTPSAKAYCVRHRGAHVEFSTRYNETVAGLDRRNAVASARKLERLLCDWVRDHAFKYDSVLIDLLKPGSRR